MKAEPNGPPDRPAMLSRQSAARLEKPRRSQGGRRCHHRVGCLSMRRDGHLPADGFDRRGDAGRILLRRWRGCSLRQLHQAGSDVLPRVRPEAPHSNVHSGGTAEPGTPRRRRSHADSAGPGRAGPAEPVPPALVNLDAVATRATVPPGRRSHEKGRPLRAALSRGSMDAGQASRCASGLAMRAT